MSPRDPHAELISSRRSIPYFTAGIEHDPLLHAHLRRHRPPDSEFYGSMLREDIALHLLPYGRGIDDGFTAVLEPPDLRAAGLIRDALPSRYGPPRTLEDGVRGFAEDAAEQLLISSVAAYELDYLHSPADPEGSPVAFRLEALPIGSLGMLGGQPIQYVPAVAARDVAENGLHFVRLSSDQLLTISLDADTKETINAASRLFAAADRGQQTPLAMLQQQGQAKTGFAFDAFRGKTNQVLLSGTRQLGWTGRGLFSDGMLDPYVVWRHLQFTRFKISMRDLILKGLDDAIVRAGKVIGFQTAVALDGVLTTGDLDRAEADLRLGRTPIAELLRL
jgi:hypothetical protein